MSKRALVVDLLRPTERHLRAQAEQLRAEVAVMTAMAEELDRRANMVDAGINPLADMVEAGKYDDAWAAAAKLMCMGDVRGALGQGQQP